MESQINDLKILLAQMKDKQEAQTIQTKDLGITGLKSTLAKLKEAQGMGATQEEITPEPDIEDELPLIIVWRPEPRDELGTVVHVEANENGGLIRVHKGKFGDSASDSRSKPQFHYIWQDNSHYIQAKAEQWFRQHRYAIIPTERALGPCIKGYLPQFASGR